MRVGEVSRGHGPLFSECPERGTAYQPRATPWDQKPRTFWRSEGTLQTRGSTDRPRRYAAFLQNAPDSGCLSPGFHPGLVCIAPLGQGGCTRGSIDRVPLGSRGGT